MISILAIVGVAIGLHGGVDAMSSAEIQTCLNSHNTLRQLHQNTPNMVWDSNLASAAQAYAETLVGNNRYTANTKLEHDPTNSAKGYGENLYWSANSYGAVSVCAQASLAWYQEIDYYNYATAATTVNGEAIGHFTQLVWKDSVRLGVGIASMVKNGMTHTFIVAKYTPQGNFYYYGNKVADYAKNVLPQKAGAVVPTAEELDPSLKQDCINTSGDSWCTYFLVTKKAEYNCDMEGYDTTFKQNCYKMCGYC